MNPPFPPSSPSPSGTRWVDGDEPAHERDVSAHALGRLTKQLVDDGRLTTAKAAHVEREAQASGLSVMQYVLDRELIPCQIAARSAATAYGLTLADPKEWRLDRLPPLHEMPARLLRRHAILPLSRQGQHLTVAVAYPSTLAQLDDLQFATGLTIEGVLAPRDQLMLMLDHYVSHGDRSGAEHELEAAHTALNYDHGDNVENTGITDTGDDAPVVRFIDKILKEAIHYGASDIHFEPYEHHFRIRFRIDGVLQETAHPPVGMRTRIAARLKVMAQLDISERRLPQDGAIRLKLSSQRVIDFRINSLPTVHGEKVVLRILNPTMAQRGIDELGFTPAQRALYERSLHAPQGMILVTGPTGSGKTVTLYAGLNALNTQDRNISTAEDPVELRLSGINQVAVAPKIGLDFATALRAFLRQDPDVVMIGEIRDRETADIAVKASQTGHLVLSTLHTNSAADTLTRLANMGVAAFNIASSVSLVIAQRLVRRLCPHCRRRADIPYATLEQEGFSDEEIATSTIYQAVGCHRCTSGYSGRLGIHEMLPIDATITRSILRHDDALSLAAQARQAGYPDLRRHGLIKVMEGMTSLEEINRVL